MAGVVARQREFGIDLINDGEYSKGDHWLRYMQKRFGDSTDIETPEAPTWSTMAAMMKVLG